MGKKALYLHEKDKKKCKVYECKNKYGQIFFRFVMEKKIYEIY